MWVFSELSGVSNSTLSEDIEREIGLPLFWNNRSRDSDHAPVKDAAALSIETIPTYNSKSTYDFSFLKIHKNKIEGLKWK